LVDVATSDTKMLQ